MAGYDPSKNHVRPQWPQHSSPQSICPAQQQQSTVHLLRLSPSDPSIYTYAGHIGELEKAKRCLASDPASANSLVEAGGRSRTLSASQILLQASPLPSGLAQPPLVGSSVRSRSHVLLCCPIYSQASRQGTPNKKYPSMQFAINNQV